MRRTSQRVLRSYPRNGSACLFEPPWPESIRMSRDPTHMRIRPVVWLIALLILGSLLFLLIPRNPRNLEAEGISTNSPIQISRSSDAQAADSRRKNWNRASPALLDSPPQPSLENEAQERPSTPDNSVTNQGLIDLSTQLNSGDVSAAAKLFELGRIASPLLATALTNDAHNIRLSALNMLRSITTLKEPLIGRPEADVVFPFVFERLRLGQASERARAADVLSQLGASAQGALTLLEEIAATDPVDHTREKAQIAIRAIRENRPAEPFSP